MPFSVGLALALSAAFVGPSSVPATSTPAVIPMAPAAPAALVSQGSLKTIAQASQTQADQPATIRESVEDYFSDLPIMVAIASCESHFHQYAEDGSAFRGEQNHHDIGVMQINEHYHLDTAKKLKLDIYSLQGNMAYARFLYDEEGTAPWDSSSPCWSKSKAAQDLATAKNK